MTFLPMLRGKRIEDIDALLGTFSTVKPCTITPGCIKVEGHESQCTVLK